MQPRSVAAIVGASDNVHIHKIGGRPLHYLLNHGYRGKLFAVNPRSETVQGLVAYPAWTVAG